LAGLRIEEAPHVCGDELSGRRRGTATAVTALPTVARVQPSMGLGPAPDLA